MSLTEDNINTSKENHYKMFSKIIGKNNSTIFVDHLYAYCEEYAENNNCSFLLDEIINTKVSFFQEVMTKNNYIKDSIKDKIINPSKLCYMNQEDIEPDKYKHILEKRELEEYRKNNQATSDAFKCKKCGERKCQVTQKQTRSGDEPATTFVECIECGYMFKF
jgi:DNA-directed RNA polymerase subunit M/transcription elongation factor TFIIS